MKKVLKRLISVMLMVILSLIPITVNAQVINENIYIVQKAYGFMQIAMSNSEAYGLDYSEENFYISQCIPAYTLNQGIVSICDEIKFYFILENDKPVAELTVISDADDIAPSIQFSTDLSNSYQYYDEETFTIVLGDEHPYFAKLGETDTQIFSTGLIKNTNPNMGTYTTSSYPSGYNISLPIKAQGNFGLCWAASVASVGQYKTGINKTAQQVASAMGMDNNEGGSCYDISNALSSIYGISANVTDGYLYTQSVADIMMSGGGIIASCLTSNLAYGHAVAISAYNANPSGCYYTIMDPNYSSYRMMTNGTDSNGFNTYCFSYSGYGTFYWYATVYFF